MLAGSVRGAGERERIASAGFEYEIELQCAQDIAVVVDRVF